jgi:Beta-glucan synthesis-associated protein SKN1/KRE6/Sbg1
MSRRIPSRTCSLRWDVCGKVGAGNRYFRGNGTYDDGGFDLCSDVDTALFQFTYDQTTEVLTGQVSQSGQFAVSPSTVCHTRKAYTSLLQPFNHGYIWPYQNNSIFYDTTVTQINPYKGGVFQQAVSALTETDPTAYEKNGANFSVYGFEYKPGTDNAVCTVSHSMSM